MQAMRRQCREVAGAVRWPHRHRPTATSTATSTDGNWCYEALGALICGIKRGN